MCSNVPFYCAICSKAIAYFICCQKQIDPHIAVRNPWSALTTKLPASVAKQYCSHDTDNVQIIMCCFIPYINFYMNFVLVCSKYIVTFSKIHSMILYELRLVTCLALGNEASMRAFIIASKFSLDNNFNPTKFQSKLVESHFN